MPTFAIEQDRWGYYVIVDRRSGTRAAATRDLARAEHIVERLNAEVGPLEEETVQLPDAVEAPPTVERAPQSAEPSSAGVSGWSTRART